MAAATAHDESEWSHGRYACEQRFFTEYQVDPKVDLETWTPDDMAISKDGRSLYVLAHDDFHPDRPASDQPAVKMAKFELGNGTAVERWSQRLDDGTRHLVLGLQDESRLYVSSPRRVAEYDANSGDEVVEWTNQALGNSVTFGDLAVGNTSTGDDVLYVYVRSGGSHSVRRLNRSQHMETVLTSRGLVCGLVSSKDHSELYFVRAQQRSNEVTPLVLPKHGAP